MSFGDNLKEARLSRGLTQIQIANQLGIDKSTYSGYESGKRQPDVKRIKELAGILNVSADELLDVHISVTTYINYSPAKRYEEAINNRDEIRNLLDMALSSTTEDVWRIIEIWRLVQQPLKKK